MDNYKTIKTYLFKKMYNSYKNTCTETNAAGGTRKQTWIRNILNESFSTEVFLTKST